MAAPLYHSTPEEAMAFEDPPPDKLGENVPMPFAFQVVGVIFVLATLGVWLYLVTT